MGLEWGGAAQPRKKWDECGTDMVRCNPDRDFRVIYFEEFHFVLKLIALLEYSHDSPVQKSCDGWIKYLFCGRS